MYVTLYLSPVWIFAVACTTWISTFVLSGRVMVWENAVVRGDPDLCPCTWRIGVSVLWLTANAATVLLGAWFGSAIIGLTACGIITLFCGVWAAVSGLRDGFQQSG